MVLVAANAWATLRDVVLIDLDGGPGPGGNLYGYASPALGAYDGGWFLSWTDERHGSLPKVYGARVTAAGAVLDDGGFAIAPYGLVHKSTAVACGASSCAVAWSAESSQHYVNVTAFDIVSRTYGFDGVALGPDFVVASGPAFRASPAVAASPTTFVFAWADEGSILVRARSGAMSGPTFTLDSSGAADVPSVAWNGAEFLVTWASSLTVRAQRLSPGGAPLGAPFNLGPGDDPRAAGGGDTFAVTWFDSVGSTDTVSVARIDDAGTVLDPGGLTVATQSGINGAPGSTVAWDGTGYLVVWESTSSRLQLRTLSFAAGLGAGTTTLGPGLGGSPAVSFAGSAGAVASIDGPVQLIGLAPGGAQTFGPQLVAANGSSQTHARAAFDGTALTVVWDSVSGIEGSRLARLDTNLQRLGATASLGDNASGRGGTAVAFDGRQSWVSWYEFATRDRVFVRPVGSSTLGPPVMVSGMAPLDALRDSAIAGGDGTALVVWSMDTGGSYGVAAVRIADGGLVDPPDTQLTPGAVAGSQFDPSVAYGGGQFVVAWDDGATRALRFARVSAATGQVSVGPPVVQPGAAEVPKVASNGRDFLVAWLQLGDSPEVHARRIDADGGIDATSLVLSSTLMRPSHFPSSVAVAFDGLDYVVAWEMFTDAGVDLHMRRVAADGGLSPTEVLIGDPYDQAGVSLTPLTTGRVLATWQGFEPAANERRIFGRLIANVPLGSPCGHPSECVQGACVNDVCSGAGGGSAGGASGGSSAGMSGGGAGGTAGGSAGSSGGGSGGAAGASTGGGSTAASRLTVQCGCGQAGEAALALAAALLVSARASRRAGRRRAPPG